MALLIFTVTARGAAGTGGQEVVLPGFAPLQLSGTRISAGPRRYDWEASFLPTKLYSLGSVVAGPLQLRLTRSGQRIVLRPSSVRVLESTPHHVVIEALGEPVPGLVVQVTTRVEYDGVAMVTLLLTPRVPVDVDGLDFEADVRTNQASRTLRFQTADIRRQKRDQEIGLSYAGPFLNAVDFSDGDRSFWWFADNAKGWIWNGPTVTEFGPSGDGLVRLRQRLIGARYRIAAPMRLEMNFLVTPVKDLGAAWRRERLVAGVSRAEGELGTLHGGWTTAFAHTALPFTEPPPSVLTQIPATDWSNYPGLAYNRELAAKNLATRGLYSLPYFSAHCLSALDPTLVANRTFWEVDPPFVVLNSNDSYPTRFEKPVLSHRASGYASYALSRMDVEIDKLGINGLYLDHASIMDSRSPYNGAWYDSNGRLQASTDILGMRSFLKRLRTLFHQKGRPGFVLVHASNSELVPAYSFSTAIVDGEHFRHRLVADDYIASVPLDQVRVQNAPMQYGVRNVWIPQFEYHHRSDPTWFGTSAARRAFRNFMTLVLLHDGEFWPVGVPDSERLPLLSALDAFGVSAAKFRGYWNETRHASTSRALARISSYWRPGKLLLVVGNLSSAAESVDVRVFLASAGLPATATARLVPEGTPLPMTSGRIDLAIPAKDFRLIRIE
jgi:hypothetical protein